MQGRPTPRGAGLSARPTQAGHAEGERAVGPIFDLLRMHARSAPGGRPKPRHLRCGGALRGAVMPSDRDDGRAALIRIGNPGSIISFPHDLQARTPLGNRLVAARVKQAMFWKVGLLG